MRRIIQLSILVSFLAVYFMSACKKEEKIYTPVPFLTGRIWIADTITINPPMTYSQLSNADQQSYRAAYGWFKIARLTLNDNGAVTSGGDYDFGYRTWRLINNNLDIEMTLNNGDKQILRNWVADASHFSYNGTIRLNTTFDGTFVYK
jgi:hypothetical protein